MTTGEVSFFLIYVVFGALTFFGVVASYHDEIKKLKEKVPPAESSLTFDQQTNEWTLKLVTHQVGGAWKVSAYKVKDPVLDWSQVTLIQVRER